MAPSAADAFCVAASGRAPPVVVVLELLAVDGAGDGAGAGAGVGAGAGAVDAAVMTWRTRAGG